jgi:hypothetical protein
MAGGSKKFDIGIWVSRALSIVPLLPIDSVKFLVASFAKNFKI